MSVGNRFAGKQNVARAFRPCGFSLCGAVLVPLALHALLPLGLQLTLAGAIHESPHSAALNRGSMTRPASNLKTNGKIAFGSKRDGNNETVPKLILLVIAV